MDSLKLFFFIFLSLYIHLVIAQDYTKKTYNIKRVNTPPKIDGILDDEAWKNASVAKNFTMLRPDNGKKEPDNKKTEVRIVYDDEAIYVGAYMYDDTPENIPVEFQTRDNFGNADFFAFVINPANDGINQFEFFLTSAGNQNDAIVTASGEDFSWNAVWKSSVSIVDNGWIAEMKIPYFAIRFSDDPKQTWSMNLHRHFRNTRDQYVWNPVNIEVGSIAQYDGIIEGISNIKPPLRLSFNPFISGIVSNYAGNTSFDWTAGMDLKYGINKNFTLDATLIPDFGQANFDDIILNLGPFEQIYSEQRAFFIEGTELFSKGNLFNSRRIGGTPTKMYDIYSELNNTEEIIENPDKVDVLNIVKISGRTKNGLGIGVLNAITNKTEAIIKDTSNENQRLFVTEPLANYNVFVLDQQFNKNSSISLINTNVMRNGDFRDANVTSLMYNINKKDNSYGITGGFSISNIFENNQTLTGKQANIYLGKRAGQHRYGIGARIMDDKYDKNDLGYQRRNNYINYNARYSYRQFRPKGIFNNYRFYSNVNIGYLYTLDKTSDFYIAKQNKYTSANGRFGFRATTKKLFTFGGNFNTGFGKFYDYFEPRVSGRFIELNSDINGNLYISTDYSKKIAIDIFTYYGKTYNQKNSYWTGIGINPRIRFNNKFTLNYGIDISSEKEEIGFADFDDSYNSIFGKRDTYNLENSVSGKYNFSTRAALGLSIRHYWIQINYADDYLLLNTNGKLVNTTYSENNNNNFNTWNFDLKFNWEFAPGSQFVALYRNYIYKSDDKSRINFNENFNNLFNDDLWQNFSIRLIYFLDYNQAKNWI